jgi:RND family efflux transporter MFP subunit
MEYPPLVAGESERAAIHLTDLADFSPVADGEVIVAMRGENGDVLEFRGGASRPGVFGVDLDVAKAGNYDMTLRIESAAVQDVHELGEVTVYLLMAPTLEDEGHDDGISFLKEQQWTLDFGTTAVAERGIRPAVTVRATVEPRSGGDVVLTAPVPGRIDPTTRVPVPGTSVESGTVLARIAPRASSLRDGAGLRASLVEAEQAHRLAVQDRDRAARLVAARAVPARRLEEAEATLAASTAALQASRERWNHFGALSDPTGDDASATMLAVVAPFEGVVSEVQFTAGGSVDESAPLLRIVDPDDVYVVGVVPESAATALNAVEGGELVLARRASVPLGAPLATAPMIDPVTRTSSIRFALDNREVGLRIGQSAQVRLFIGGESEVTAVPESAIVDDAGVAVVFIQTGGETFERRPVQLGNRAEGYVTVLGGVTRGERVVDRGAYLVRLASMTDQAPGHGHVH